VWWDRTIFADPAWGLSTTFTTSCAYAGGRANDFVDVRDVAIGHRLAQEKGRPGWNKSLSGHQIKLLN
jgi:cytochrome c peroxidase